VKKTSRAPGFLTVEQLKLRRGEKNNSCAGVSNILIILMINPGPAKWAFVIWPAALFGRCCFSPFRPPAEK
jgi:hypothetical protein